MMRCAVDGKDEENFKIDYTEQMRNLLRLLASLIAAFLSFATHAHPLDLGLVQFQMDGNKIEFTFDLNPKVVTDLFNEKPDSLNVSTVQARAEKILDLTLRREPLMSNGGTCSWGQSSSDLLPNTIRVQGTITCPGNPESFTWKLPFIEDPRLPKAFQVMIRLKTSGNEQVQLMERGKTEWQGKVDRVFSLGTFVKMGIDHIGVSPSQWWENGRLKLPDGIDHILFVVVLVLCGGTVWGLIGTATGFTVGHSITLALASFDLLHFPSRFVESAIALSIVYLAVEAVVQKTPKYRWAITSFFGTVHGLGFATAIRDLHLQGSTLLKALVGFNVGVEIGQAIIILILAPLFFLLAKKPKVQRMTQVGLASIIFLIGSVWFIQRAFL